MLPHYTMGRDTLYDVTVINAMRQDLLNRAAEQPKYAVCQAFATKWGKYGNKCESEGLCFILLAVDSMGAWHDRAVAEIKKLGSMLARASGEEDSQAIHHVFQRLSVLLAKGNSSIILSRTPNADYPLPHIIGHH